ncbi:MAG: hypothetical protein JXA41_15475 [Deltaproteobacteria bacterium]|nr:hypothetical protein [Deltaproteobacteria bacterium]
MKFLNGERLKVILSTNCSKVVLFDEGNILSNLHFVMFSMPGFSQQSYDKIHGFKFEKIVKNMLEIKQNFRSAGFIGMFILAFHIYQFNVNEIQPAAEFAGQNQFEFVPFLAFINDFQRQLKYMRNELDDHELKRASQKLFLYYFSEDRKKQRPQNYVCPQFSKLAIDEHCNIITCCGDTTPMDKLFNVRPDDVNRWRMSSKVCRECREAGLDFLVMPPPMENVLTFQPQPDLF